jgi:hypothetical protein
LHARLPNIKSHIIARRETCQKSSNTDMLELSLHFHQARNDRRGHALLDPSRDCPHKAASSDIGLRCNDAFSTMSLISFAMSSRESLRRMAVAKPPQKPSRLRPDWRGCSQSESEASSEPRHEIGIVISGVRKVSILGTDETFSEGSDI